MQPERRPYRTDAASSPRHAREEAVSFASGRRMRKIHDMTKLPLLIAALLAAAVLPSCSGLEEFRIWHPRIGPFDLGGFYVEEWADNPPPRDRFGRPIIPGDESRYPILFGKN